MRKTLVVTMGFAVLLSAWSARADPGAVQDRVLFTAPFEWVLPAPCIDDEIRFTGEIISLDHYVLPPGQPHGEAVHDNWLTWYDGEWTALGSGETFVSGPGLLNHAVVLVPNGPVAGLEDLVGLHQVFHLVLIESSGDERLTLGGRLTLVKNAAGEIKVEVLVLDRCHVAR